MAFIPHKTPMLGFALQSGPGDVQSQATHVFPGRDGSDFKAKPVREVYQNNAGSYERDHYYISGMISEGTLNMPLVPGMLTTSGDIWNWLWGRANEASYFEGYYATIFQFLGNGFYAVFPDVKCTGGGIKVDEKKTVDLSIKALSGASPRYTGDGLGSEPNSGIFPSYSSAIWHDQAPYTYDSCDVQVGYSSSSLSVDEYTKGHSVEWDNMVAGQDVMSMLNYGYLGPKFLPNTARTQWKGGFSRAFFDTNLILAFMNMTAEGAYYLRLRQGGSTFALTLPRIIWADGGWPSMPTSDIVMHDGVAFEALGVQGKPGTPCFTITEA